MQAERDDTAIAHALPAALLLVGALLLPAAPAEAATIQISGTGTSLSPVQALGIFESPTFTFELLLDSTVPSGSGGGTALAVFEGAVTSFAVDGVTLPLDFAAANQVVFGQTFDPFIFTQVADSVFNVSFPLRGFFGSGPFDLTQIVGLDQSDFGSGLGFVDVSLGGIPDGSGGGSVTSFTVVELDAPAIPLPASLPLLLAGLGGLAALRRHQA